jgi:hypothetical protein
MKMFKDLVKGLVQGFVGTAGALISAFLVLVAFYLLSASRDHSWLRTGANSVDVDVLLIRPTNTSAGEYEVTLRNNSSRNIVFTYIKTSDGFDICPTQHTLRANSTSRDLVRCNNFRSIQGGERFQLFVTPRLGGNLGRNLNNPNAAGEVYGFR